MEIVGFVLLAAALACKEIRLQQDIYKEHK